jgi:hypothetical protein
MFCTHCAFQQPDGNRFCSNCGAPQPQASPPPPPQALSVGQPAPLANRPNSQLAIASISLSIAAWIIVPFLGALAGIVCGHLARAELRKRPELSGSGLALAGLIIGYSQLVLGCLVISLFAAIASRA